MILAQNLRSHLLLQSQCCWPTNLNYAELIITTPCQQDNWVWIYIIQKLFYLKFQNNHSHSLLHAWLKLSSKSKKAKRQNSLSETSNFLRNFFTCQGQNKGRGLYKEYLRGYLLITITIFYYSLQDVFASNASAKKNFLA